MTPVTVYASDRPNRCLDIFNNANLTSHIQIIVNVVSRFYKHLAHLFCSFSI